MQPTSPHPDSTGYVSLIQTLDAVTAVLPQTQTLTTMTYLATPNDCALFMAQLENAKTLTNRITQDKSCSPAPDLWLSSTAIAWCYDRLWESGILKPLRL